MVVRLMMMVDGLRGTSNDYAVRQQEFTCQLEEGGKKRSSELPQDGVLIAPLSACLVLGHGREWPPLDVDLTDWPSHQEEATAAVAPSPSPQSAPSSSYLWHAVVRLGHRPNGFIRKLALT